VNSSLTEDEENVALALNRIVEARMKLERELEDLKKAARAALDGMRYADRMQSEECMKLAKLVEVET
jgi:hypothetical protein